MAVKLWSNKIEQFCDSTGVPRSGAKLFTYVGGSVNTKQTTYTESTGVTPNTNPIVLDSNGKIPQPIWLTTGVNYKFVLAPSTDTDPPTSPIETLDVITGINDSSTVVNEWVAGPAPTFVGVTSFTLVGDQTSTFAVGRRLKFTVTAGTVYGRITISAFTTLTTVTVVCEPSQALDSGLSAVSYGVLASTRPSIPWITVAADTISTIASAATLNLDANAKDYAFISGTTPVTAITLAQGKECTLEFQGALTFTNGASLILPGGANITTAAGDTAIVRGEAAGVVRCITYTAVAASPLAAFTTGDVKLTIKTVADSGWVLMNDGTIGSAASGGTTRANADTSALYTLLWNNTANADCAVSTGRGVSAAADFAANKTIALPKALGRALSGYGTGAGLTARAMGAIVGEEAHALSAAEGPAHIHQVGYGGAVAGALNAAWGPSNTYVGSYPTNNNVADGGSGTAHNTMQPTLFLNVMIKL